VPAGGMLERYLDPFLHGATKAGRIKQAGTRERERFAMPGGFQLEDHGALVEPGKRLTIVLETGHAKHLSGDRGRRSGHLTGNGIVLSAWICGHSNFHLTIQGLSWAWAYQQHRYLFGAIIAHPFGEHNGTPAYASNLSGLITVYYM
jgi:hypothetical protein